MKRLPFRGEIWFVHLHTDPPEKGRRPVVIVSLDVRNRHERADTVLVVPLTTSIHKASPTHVLLPAGETGLQADSAARAEDITVVRKNSLMEPQGRLRQLSHTRVCELARKVGIAMGCPPRSVP
ncbi:Transcriptional modulator of MazE/toxin, MazF [Candidatus Sulfopaludibacter sp. SbA6]|nr:Transcriptional modulator of MazE/toxin, MazF [Candidatus Sulfopaludibacter sp. SbA6]